MEEGLALTCIFSIADQLRPDSISLINKHLFRVLQPTVPLAGLVGCRAGWFVFRYIHRLVAGDIQWLVVGDAS